MNPSSLQHEGFYLTMFLEQKSRHFCRAWDSHLKLIRGSYELKMQHLPDAALFFIDLKCISL